MPAVMLHNLTQFHKWGFFVRVTCSAVGFNGWLRGLKRRRWWIYKDFPNRRSRSSEPDRKLLWHQQWKWKTTPLKHQHSPPDILMTNTQTGAAVYLFSEVLEPSCRVDADLKQQRSSGCSSDISWRCLVTCPNNISRQSYWESSGLLSVWSTG